MKTLSMCHRKFEAADPPQLWSLLAVAIVVVCASTLAFAAPAASMSLLEVEKRHYELVKRAKEILHSRGDWDEARKLLDDARNLRVTTPRDEFPYRSTESKVADFYYAWILCQTPAGQGEGRDLLDKTLQNDLWPAEKQAILKDVRANCGHEHITPGLADGVIIEEKFQLAAIQKGGNWSQPVRLKSRNELPIAPWDQRADAQAAIEDMFDPSYNLIEAQPFLVAGRFPKPYLAELAITVLVPYFNHIMQSVGVEYDWGVIYVFVAADHNQFAGTTGALYSVDSENQAAIDIAIGFSDLPNKTIIAICGKKASNCTTFAHEIFHLLNSKVFEDAPWWLYEGAAELFESGELSEGVFHARSGWRDCKAAIDELNPESFRDLLTISKNDPELYDPPGDEVAMARVRTFSRYLLEQEALWTIYDELRRRDWHESTMDPAGIVAIEKTLNRPIDEVYRDFREWFVQVVLPEPCAPGP